MRILTIGATGNIGKRLCKELSLSHEIFGCGRRENVLKEMKDEKILVDYILADITKSEDRLNLVKYSERNYIESVIYAQGILDYKDFKSLSEEEIENIIRTNFSSIIHLDNLFLNHYLPHFFVYFCSISSLYSWSSGIVYQSTKTGLAAHVSSLRLYDKTKGSDIKRLVIYPDTIEGQEGMSSELKEFPKIPLNSFIAEIKNLIEKATEGDYLFIIKENEVFLEKILINEETGRPLTYFSKKIKKLGKPII